MRIYYKATYTYKIFRLFKAETDSLIKTIQNILAYGLVFLQGLKNKPTTLKETLFQCSRFGVSSLPITLSIVGMTSIIVAMQVAGEMVKQGGGNYVGMLVSILMVREEGVIMSGFAMRST